MKVALKSARLIIHYELVILALVAPFLLFPGKWAFWAAIPLLLIWPARRLATGRFTRPSPMNTPLLLLLLLTVIAYSIAVDQAMSWAKLWGIVLQAAIFWGLANGLRSRQAVRQVGLAMAGLTLLVASLSLVGTDWDSVRLLNLPQVYERLPRLPLTLPGSGVPRLSDFFHPRQVGGTMAFLLPPLLLYIFTTNRWRWPRLLGILAAALGGLVLLLSLAPAGYLGLAAALLAVGLWRTRWLLLPLGILPLLVFAGQQVVTWRPAALSLLAVEHVLGVGVVLRLDIWSRSLAMVRDMPYTGVGLNNFPIIQAYFYPGVLLGPNEVHAHNLFLQTAVDLGLPGLLALLWLLVAFYKTVFQAYRLSGDREVRLLLVGLAAGVLAFIVGGIPDAITLGAKPVAAIAAMWGTAAAILSLERAEQSVTVQPAAGQWPVAVVGVVMIGVLTATLLLPAAWLYNRATIAGHQAIWAARQATAVGNVPEAATIDQMTKARNWLVQAVTAGLPFGVQQEAQAMALLSSLAAWQGDYETAEAALACRVALDGSQAMVTYAPFETARRQVAGEPLTYSWSDTIRLYRQWQIRYPDRAEGYGLLALAHLARGAENDQTQATAVLHTGLAHGARPAGLLLAQQRTVSEQPLAFSHICQLTLAANQP